MGAFCKVIDAVLFIYFAFTAITAPLLDGQMILPEGIFPAFLVDLSRWYAVKFDDYLVIEKPYFLVGLIWYELLILWPLSIVNLYAILARKSWFGTTSMVYGASAVTFMAAVFGDIIGSGKATERLLMIVVLLMGFCILALLRGFFYQNGGAVGMRPVVLARRKRA